MGVFNPRIDVEIPTDAAQELRRIAGIALEEVAGEVDARFDAAISDDSAWPWPRESKRGLGSPGTSLKEKIRLWNEAEFNVSTPRSIVDSGDLKQSKMMEVNLDTLTAEWVWTAPYAAAVHDGAWIYPWHDTAYTRVLLPARQWTDAVLLGNTMGDVEVYPFSDELSRRIGEYAN